MTQIERRQARIRRIRAKLATRDESVPVDPNEFGIATSPSSRYHVGATQNQPVHLLSFVYANSHDPAVKVSASSGFEYYMCNVFI